METGKEGMTRREFLKRNVIILAALAFLGSPLKSFAGIFKRQPRGPNVSDKEGRYYRTLAG
jgi:anaerobic selenocysteine-containing dehydrogenase